MKKIIILKKPTPLIKAEREKKSIDKCWPDVLNHVEKYPDSTNETLFNLFHERTGDINRVVFGRKCALRGLKEFRQTIKGKVKGGRFKESRQLTENVVENFKKDRLSKGVLHLSKMDIMMSRAHQVLDKESINVLEEAENNVGIGTHLAHHNQAHRLAKDVYRIDVDDKHDSSKVNLAIIMSFDPGKPSDVPEEREAKGSVLDV